jgi:hypothetical protein
MKPNQPPGRLLKKTLVSLGAGILGLCGLGVFLYYGYDYWRSYSIFRQNFAMSFIHTHQFKGKEAAWMSYSAWVSFTYDGALNLAHPEDYRDVSCTADMVKYNDPFVSKVDFLSERRPKESLRLYERYLNRLRELLPRLQCKAGRTNFRVTATGEKASDISVLVDDPQNRQVLFEIEDHLFY